jgi:hypothetical protein
MSPEPLWRASCSAGVLRAALIALVPALVLAAPAAGKVWFQDIGRRTVHWDQRVVASISGCAEAPGCGQVVGRRLVFLRAVGGHRLVRLARIDETGRVRFGVPHVAPGRYRLVANEAGRARHVSSWFRVTRRR